MSKLTLTSKQSYYLDAIEWLINNSRGEGKSFLLYVAIMQRAIKEEGGKVYLYSKGRELDYDIRYKYADGFKKFLDMYLEDSEYEYKLYESDYSLVITKKET